MAFVLVAYNKKLPLRKREKEMNFLLKIKRPFIWIKRFRKRCGYGVHSPFAFDFITNVIYEKTTYYAYFEIKQATEYEKVYYENSEKINRLLFRLVNKTQPNNIISTSNFSSKLYLRAAKKSACFLYLNKTSFLLPKEVNSIDFLYLSDYKDPISMEKILKDCLAYINQQSVIVIRGIHYSTSMKKLWKKTLMCECVGITFDLYDLGILFFDKTKLKQHYTVNF